jgi:hypothetical protein
MTDESIDTAAAPRRLGWAAATTAIAFGVLYAYDLWEAVSNAVSLPQVYSVYGLDPGDVPWALLVAGILLPVVIYGVAFLLGRRRPLFATIVLFAVGLALVAVLSLDLIAVQGRMLTQLFAS